MRTASHGSIAAYVELLLSGGMMKTLGGSSGNALLDLVEQRLAGRNGAANLGRMDADQQLEVGTAAEVADRLDDPVEHVVKALAR